MSRSTRAVQHMEQSAYGSSTNERAAELDLHYPVCYQFSPNSGDSDICECNRHRKYHPMRTSKQQLQGSKQDNKNRLRLQNEEAHGKLTNDARFARFDIETDLKTVERLLFNVWKLPKPKLIMSIVGGAKTFTLNERLKTNFINGIVNIAIRSDIWMITSGYNNGLVQLIGKAIRKVKLKESKKKLIAMAMCKWGSVKNPHKLITTEGKRAMIQKQGDSSDSSDNEVEIETKDNDGYNLDMNHTHYLMLDDANYRRIDTGNYRTRLCKQIAKFDSKVFAATVVVEGGDATIANIYYDLQADIPVVIMEGTGRVADFFCRWLLYTKSFDKDSKRRQIIYGIDELISEVTEFSGDQKPRVVRDRRHELLNYHCVYIDLDSKTLADIFSDCKEELKKDLRKLLFSDNHSNMTKRRASHKDKNDPPGLTTAYDQVMFCLQPSIRSNITVFHLNSETDLSGTIFRSISQSYEKVSKRRKIESKGNKSELDAKEKDQEERTPLFELAMDLDCIDVAKEFVLKNSLDDISNVGGTFKDALKRNLYTFIDEFIKLGVNPADIFFPNNIFTKGGTRYEQFLSDLYTEEVINVPTTDLQIFIDEDRELSKRPIDTTDSLNVLFRNLVGDYMHKLYFDSLKEENDDRIKSGVTQKLISTDDNSSTTVNEGNEMARDYIMRDLFLWAILMNYTDMAKVLLTHMKYRICPALIATKIFKEYIKNVTYGELQDSYAKSAKYFEEYAVNCLDKCDDHDASKACEIVLQQNELYGYVTCLQVASDADDKLFLAAPCCIEAMYNIWYDKIYPIQTRKRDLSALLIGIITLGFLAPSAVEFRQLQETRQGVPPEKNLRTNGINYCDPYPLEYPRRFKHYLSINLYYHKFINFHQSLLVKVAWHFIFYCFFLLLFSYVLLFDFDIPTNQIPSIHWTEILTIILVTSMLIEEIHHFFMQDSLSIPGKLKSYFRDLFKPLIVIAIILFYIGLIVRFTNATTEVDFAAARVIMAIDIELWWLCLLSFIKINPFLGPHLVAIQKMLKDLLFFLCIIFIVMAGYGVASRSMVYYPQANNFTIQDGGPIDPSFDGRRVFGQVLYPVYYLLHGQLDDELANLDTQPEAGWSISTHVLLAFHMLFVNILLTNLLIAMFSKRYEEVHEETQHIWHAQQYLFSREYFTRAPFLPPVSLVYNIYYLIRLFVFFIRRLLHKSVDRSVRVFKMIPREKAKIKEWFEFEGAATYEYAHAEVKALKATLTKSSTEQDSQHADKTEDKLHQHKNSTELHFNIKQVQQDVANLKAAIEGMRLN